MGWPLLLVLLTAPAAPAKDWARPLFRTKTAHDFGTVARGAVVEHRFLLENIYLEDVEIVSLTSTCGCTALRATKNLLKTYETSEIIAELDTRRFVGFKDSTIKVVLKVHLNKPRLAEVPLYLSAFIRGDVVFEPGAVQFGTVPQGHSARRRVAVNYAGRSDWQIVGASSTWPHLEVSFKQTGRSLDPTLQATQVTYDVEVTLASTAPAGYFKQQLLLQTNDPNPQTARVPLMVEGQVAAPLTANPTMLLLGMVAPDQAVSRNLIVRGNRPFRILQVTGPDERFRFTPAQDVRAVHLIPVQFTAGKTPGKVSGTIRIQTDLDGASVEVAVEGQVAAPASADPDAKTSDK